MANIMICPSKYVQAAGELKRLGTYAAELGKKAILVVDHAYDEFVEMIRPGMEEAGLGSVFETFGGECCVKEIQRLIGIMKEEECDMVVGIGGGKVLDTAKAMAHHTKTPMISCPTAASTDAPCSRVCVVYTEDGVVDLSERLICRSNPSVVLVDTEIIAKAPMRLNVSGMGDALATYFEARVCRQKDGLTCAGGAPTLAASALAQLCFQTLMEEGLKAKAAMERGICSPSVEKVIEANILMSGIGFESGGLSAAHALHNGLTTLKGCHGKYHGEKVSFGTIVQLVLENVPLSELERILGFCVDLGLPVTLEDLGVTEVTEEELLHVAEVALPEGDLTHPMPFALDPKTMVEAIKAADAYGHAYHENGRIC